MIKLKFSLVILLGACSYGVLSSILKIGFLNGFSFPELLGGQFVFGWFGLLLLVLIFSRYKVSLKNILSLLAVGTTMSLTSIFYGLSVKELPASIAIVLLFQFTWMGVLIEAIANKAFPSREKLLSILILLLGTVFAGGLFDGSIQQLSIKGIIFGLLAAITFSFYFFVSGRVSTDVPVVSKSFFMATGATLLVCLVYPPTYLIDGTLQTGLWKYALILGFFGVVIPIMCFSIGVPKVGTGLATILGAIELPTAVIASITLLNEFVSPLKWIGIIIILFGILIPQILKIRKEKRQNFFREDTIEN